MDWTVLLTRGIVLAMYVAVFIYACATLRVLAGNWTRKASLVIIMIISAYWTGFMATLLYLDWGSATVSGSPISLFARIGHYVVAGGMWTIIGFLRTVALKYDIVSIKKSP